MADLRPIPLATLLKRAYHEFARSRAIFDLPARSFYRTPNFSDFSTGIIPGSEDPGLRQEDASRPRDRVTEPVPGPRPSAKLTLRHAQGAVSLSNRRAALSERSESKGGSPVPDLSLPYAGTRAPNPIGPAAGPHTQLAQNIVLSWLAGAGIIELKTVQLNDRLTLSRPCIDMKTVGYNTEWSQELPLELSLREYVKGSMVIDMLAGIRDSGFGIRPDPRPVFDISVGYDLAGITSLPVVHWLERMADATRIVEELRAGVPGEFSRLRDVAFRIAVSRSVTLSTFHGAPASEIERICEFLIGELGLHTVIKLNPPMLGRERVEHILHDVLGYEDVVVNPEVYERELRFDEGVDLVRRLQTLAARRGVSVGVKCGNTLEVRNTGAFLKEPVQYLSGQPLHALHVALVQAWREQLGPDLLISFSGGVDAHNAADCVAAGLVPVTTCTDLLRPGGYARLPKYLQSLASRMKQLGAQTIEEFVEKSAEESTGPRSQAPGPFARALTVNSSRLLERALTDDRYRAERNRKPPRKLGTQLWLWDCLSCRKCIPVCPNDAIFELETESFVGEVPVIAITPDGWQERERRLYRALKTTQIMIFADACNDCGNCDVFCPEDGGPNIEKPRFFGSLEAYRQAAPLTGFVLTMEPGAAFELTQAKEAPGLLQPEEQASSPPRAGGRNASPTLVVHGRFADGEYVLEHAPGSDTALFLAPGARLTIAWASHSVLRAEPVPGPRPWAKLGAALSERSESKGGSLGPVCVSLEPYLTLRLLLGALMAANRVNFVNADLATAAPEQGLPPAH